MEGRGIRATLRGYAAMFEGGEKTEVSARPTLTGSLASRVNRHRQLRASRVKRVRTLAELQQRVCTVAGAAVAGFANKLADLVPSPVGAHSRI